MYKRQVSLGGVIVGLFSVTSLIVRPFTGYIADNYNKKFLLIAGLLVTALGILGYVSTQNLMILTVFRVIHGVAFALPVSYTHLVRYRTDDPDGDIRASYCTLWI